MKQYWKDMGIAVVMGVIVPAMMLAAAVSLAPEKEEASEQYLQTEAPEQTEPAAPQLKITVLTGEGQTVQMPLDAYLTCVVLAEMPVSFEEEALKAQTVVARTYTIRAMNGAAKHDDAAVCTDSACCQGYMEVETFIGRGGKETDVQHIRQIVASTEGQVLIYEGKLIEATYFSCSGGSTEDAVAVWGTDVPYLQAVQSPGEEHATHYTDTVTFTAAELASKLDLELSGKPSGWFGTVTYTDGGGVESMYIGDKSFSGTQLRRLLDLRSTAFDVAVDGDTIAITTRGFGHRVGMSQYGADAMAAAGSSYEEILTYYYRGTELTQYAD